MLSLIPFVAWAAFSHAVTLPSQCSCGYQDPLSLSVYTEALIVYFNETDTIDQFIVGDFAHKKEHGWYLKSSFAKLCPIQLLTIKIRTQELHLQSRCFTRECAHHQQHGFCTTAPSIGTSDRPFYSGTSRQWWTPAECQARHPVRFVPSRINAGQRLDWGDCVVF